MSFSFTVTKPTRAEVIQGIDDQLAQVVIQQKAHVFDCGQIQTAAYAHLDILPEASDTQDYSVYILGSICWKGDETQKENILGASFTINASLTDRK
jgi:hypothetical protein